MGHENGVGPTRRHLDDQPPKCRWQLERDVRFLRQSRHRERGTSTASQTTWAIISLIARDEAANPAAKRGADYLARTHHHDGSRYEPYYTGTGFPGCGVGRLLNRYLPEGDPGYQGTSLRHSC